MLRIVADENITFAREAFGPLGELELLPARHITTATARDADVLLVRSVTRVDAGFATLPSLRFVGTVTIGTDHIDSDALRAAGIAVHSAPGSNADSVVEYVIAALLVLAERRQVPLRGRTVGVIGCGNIGARLARRLPAFGCRVLCNDPPLQAQAEAAGAAHAYVPLEQLLAEADVVSLHVPLTRCGPHPTHHLLGERALAALRRHAWLLNTSRGSVVDNAALRTSLERRALDAAVLDVWEHEPLFDGELLRRVELGTPHIAGHSFDGKVNGTVQVHDALVRHLGVPSGWDPEAALRATAQDRLTLDPPPPGTGEAEWLRQLVRQMYDVERDDAAVRGLLDTPRDQPAEAFQELRRRYPRRRTFARHHVAAAHVPPRLHEPVRDGLMVRMTE